MPVHHEKMERTEAKRGSSRNRNVQREDSLDRRPVISQEKPVVTRSRIPNERPNDRAKIANNSPRDKTVTKAKVPSTKEKPIEKTKKLSIKEKLETTKVPSTSRDAIVKKQAKTVPATRLVASEKSNSSKETVRSRVSKPGIEKRPAQKVSTRTVKSDVGKTKSENVVTKSKTEKSSSLSKNISANKELLRTKSNKAQNPPVIPSEVRKDGSRGHDRTITRTLSPSEIKVLARSSAKKEMIDMTSEKLNVDDENKPAVEESKETVEPEDEDESNADDGEDYEDDFEDYESDFEEYSESSSNEEDSSEEQSENNIVPSNATAESNQEKLTEPTQALSANEPPKDEPSAPISARKRSLTHELSKDEMERKMDSGSYHFSTSHQKRELDEVKHAIKEENTKRSLMALKDEDEGFMEEADKPLVREMSHDMLDFASAGRRDKKRASIQKQRRRGDVLSQMITLDAITYTLMEIAPVPYDSFMKAFGRSNASQAQVQTNEDDNETETQTDDIAFKTKWTQAPTKYTPTINNDGSKTFAFSKFERLGVGHDDEKNVAYEPEFTLKVNALLFNRFLLTAGKRVRIWLEAQSQHQIALNDQKQQSSELNCCDGKISLQRNESIENSPVVLVTGSSGNNNLVLSVHKDKLIGSIIYIWTILEPSVPLKILTCRQNIESAVFGPGRGSFIFAGATDGSVNMWDAREGAEHHQEVATDWAPGRSPTYSTAALNDGHVAPVVSVQILAKDVDDVTAEFTPLQVCSMDEMGTVIVWSMVQHSGALLSAPNEDLGLAPWGKVRLVKTSMFRVAQLLPKEDLTAVGKFNVLQVVRPVSNEVLIGSTSGEVIHCSTKGMLLKPRSYKPHKNARPSAVVCLAIYPHDCRYFLAGCSDGTIRFHKSDQELPIINLHWNLSDTSPSSSIKAIQWLHSKPCMFFCLDATTRMHVWNLAVSDIYPQLTMAAFMVPITSFTLIHPKMLSQSGYLVIGRRDGNIELHKRKEEFRCKSKEEYKKERRMFQRYVTIL